MTPVTKQEERERLTRVVIADHYVHAWRRVRGLTALGVNFVNCLVTGLRSARRTYGKDEANLHTAAFRVCRNAGGMP